MTVFISLISEKSTIKFIHFNIAYWVNIPTKLSITDIIFIFLGRYFYRVPDNSSIKNLKFIEVFLLL